MPAIASSSLVRIRIRCQDRQTLVFWKAVPSERRDSAGAYREACGPALAKKLIGDVQGVFHEIS